MSAINDMLNGFRRENGLAIEPVPSAEEIKIENERSSALFQKYVDARCAVEGTDWLTSRAVDNADRLEEDADYIRRQQIRDERFDHARDEGGHR